MFGYILVYNRHTYSPDLFCSARFLPLTTAVLYYSSLHVEYRTKWSHSSSPVRSFLLGYLSCEVACLRCMYGSRQHYDSSDGVDGTPAATPKQPFWLFWWPKRVN